MDNHDLHITRQAATLRLIVEEKVRSAIARGLFKPGQRLVERELCELIGVGRTSVREALRQLEAEGLVQTIPHRGPIVSTMSSDEARQLYEIRALLEGYAGRQFAQHGPAESVKLLDKAVKNLAATIKAGDQGKYIEAKTEFYRVLMEGANNVFVSQFLTSLHNRITLLRMTSMTQPGRLTNSIREIRVIYKAIAAGDGDAAEEACRYHIEEAAKIALSILADNGGDAAVEPVKEPAPTPAPAPAPRRRRSKSTVATGVLDTE